MVAFSGDEPTVSTDGETISVTVDGETHRLTRSAARALRSAIGEAMTQRREFFRTSGEHREDGAYVVERRGADSAGNAKVFDSFDRVRRLYERLPDEFTADAVGRTGITGSRRHMLVRHFAEHPAFACEITSRNPLTVEKAAVQRDSKGRTESEAEPESEVPGATAD